MNSEENIILLTDSYKPTHYRGYSPELQQVHSYLESRGGKFNSTLFFGLQFVLKKYLVGQVVTQDKINAAAELFKKHYGSDKIFNREGWEYILNKHEGKLPLLIRSAPEGSLVPTHNVLMTIENTDTNVPWLTNYVESILLQSIWYGTTVATLSYNMKQLILKYLEETGDPALVDFKLHDFGFRGVSSTESAGLGGAAHLVNFLGTDTLPALKTIKDFYNTDVCGFSIPASEHSTICSWGKSNEAKAYENMLDQYPEGLVAVVSDSYDIYSACENIWGGTLKEKVLARNGTLVIRPDSGDPKVVLPKVLNILKNKFGGSVNSKGYYVLNPKVRVIWGDGINFESTSELLESVKQAGFSTDNVALGMGGALLQMVNRDTQKFAIKCSSVTVDSIERPVFKDPVTDSGKKSKAGKQMLYKGDGEYYTAPEGSNGEPALVDVFWNGQLMEDYTFDDVKKNLKESVEFQTKKLEVSHG